MQQNLMSSRRASLKNVPQSSRIPELYSTNANNFGLSLNNLSLLRLKRESVAGWSYESASNNHLAERLEDETFQYLQPLE